MKNNYDINVKRERKWLWEFSKRLIVGVSIFSLLVTVFVLFMIYKTQDMSYISNLIEAVADIFKIAVVGYLIKAGAENVVKVSHSCNCEQITEESQEEDTTTLTDEVNELESNTSNV